MTAATPVLVAGVAGALSVPGVHALVRRRGIVDAASERSSHSGTALRGLGVACLIGWVVALPFFASGPGALRLAVLVGPVVIAAIGFADDSRGGVPAAVRFGTTALAAVAVAWGLVDGTAASMVWVALGAVWVTYFTNAFNFMDGIDGISAATVVVMGAAYGWIGHDLGSDLLAQAGLALAASCLGFAVLNILGVGKFLGDAGSYFFGAALGTLALALFLAGAGAVAVAGAAALYVADTTTAIIRRAAHGETLSEAHREHAYQRLVDAGLSHGVVASVVAAATAVCAGVGVATDGSSTGTRAGAVAAIIVVIGCYLLAPSAIRSTRYGRRETALGGG